MEIIAALNDIQLPFPWLAFRRESDDPSDSAPLDEKARDKFAGIRCPLCRWKPSNSSRWFCADCDYPEYFYGGCETAWNSFETRGLCPTCSHQWIWTSCLQCGGWSKHEDWYRE